MADDSSLFHMNIHFLNQGADILKTITDKQYVHDKSKYYQSSVGKHMRHILDHYQSLLDGWNDKVDYDARVRNTDIETDRKAAIAKCEGQASSYRQLLKEGVHIDRTVLVKSNEGMESKGSPWSSSSVKRELQFLVSHTVHHYALMAFILRTQGVKVPGKFGVAPSTLRYHAGSELSTHLQD